MTRAGLLRRFRQVPLVLRISGAMLLLASITGQITQHRAAGAATYTALNIAERLCPSAVHRRRSLTVADGAHMLDGAAYRWTLDPLQSFKPTIAVTVPILLTLNLTSDHALQLDVRSVDFRRCEVRHG